MPKPVELKLWAIPASPYSDDGWCGVILPADQSPDDASRYEPIVYRREDGYGGGYDKGFDDPEDVANAVQRHLRKLILF